jgi:hypothetical protein
MTVTKARARVPCWAMSWEGLEHVGVCICTALCDEGCRQGAELFVDVTSSCGSLMLQMFFRGKTQKLYMRSDSHGERAQKVYALDYCAASFVTEGESSCVLCAVCDINRARVAGACRLQGAPGVAAACRPSSHISTSWLLVPYPTSIVATEGKCGAGWGTSRVPQARRSSRKQQRLSKHIGRLVAWQRQPHTERGSTVTRQSRALRRDCERRVRRYVYDAINVCGEAWWCCVCAK